MADIVSEPLDTAEACFPVVKEAYDGHGFSAPENLTVTNADLIRKSDDRK
jgi:hypothetical protein